MSSTKISGERVCKVLEGMYLLDMHEIPENNFADNVYMWCHIVEGSTCENPHEDWIEDFLKAEVAIHEATKSPAEKRRDSHLIEDESCRMVGEGCPNG